MAQNITSNADNEGCLRCLVVHPQIASPQKTSRRDLQAVLDEVEGLALAINLQVAAIDVFKVEKIQAGSFFGKGQRESVKARIEGLGVELVIFNHTLSPVQQRNLEKEWNIKVIDRTGLILEIFGARAQTKEGRLQVELAALEYQKSRLVRSWTHLERQRGGAGFMGGPGERQIELDRRMIGTRITKLKKELEDVRRTRELGRKSRERVPFPVVVLVGYTNAGKSTLFNRLTSAKVLAKDLLFATLDPTMRRVELPGGQAVILSDTVGFISDLPTHLVAAFRATLEQISYADVIVHVIDASGADYEAQRADVVQVLSDLGVEYDSDARIVEVYNKIDLLSEERIEVLQNQTGLHERRVLISAVSGAGLEDLQEEVRAIVTAGRLDVRFMIDCADGKALAWLYEHATLLERQDTESAIDILVHIEPGNLEKFTQRYGYRPQPDQ